MPRTSRTWWAVASAALVVFATSAALAVEPRDLTALSERIAALRAEVASIEDQARTERRVAQTEVVELSSARNRARLEAEAAEARAASLRQLVSERRAEVAARRARGEDLVPALRDALAGLEEVIARGTPLRRTERLGRIAELRRRLNVGAASPNTIAADAWRVVEDELQLAQSHGVHKQVITVDGTEHLANVVNVGTALLYWKLPDGRVGYMAPPVKDEDAWRVVSVGEPAAKASIEELFEALRLQQRGKMLTLPLPPVPS